MAYSRGVGRAWFVVAFVGFVGACADSEDGGADEAAEEEEQEEESETWSSDDPLLDARIGYAESWCACYWDNGNFASELECVEGFPGSGTDSCEAAVLFEDEAAAPRVRCLIDAAEAEADCVAAAQCGAMDTVVEQCQQMETAMVDACPDYPAEVQQSLSDCIEPEPFWMVGDDGMIFGIGSDGSASPEPQPVGADLLAISCDGAARAWIAGEAGTVLRTFDGGESWLTGAVPTVSTLRAVTQVDGERVAVVGDGGAMFVSGDAGGTWDELVGPTLDWTGVAAVGDDWLLAGRDGSIWSYSSDEGFAETFAFPEPLLAIDAGPDGTVAAVGDNGTLLVSDDEGRSWSQSVVPTTATLRTVDVVGAEEGIIAAGDGGVLVSIDERGVQLQVPGADGHAINGLHVTRHGDGAAVGEHGTFLVTRDGGDSWRLMDLGVDVPLYGLDQPFHAH